MFLSAACASLSWAMPAFVAHVLQGESSPFGRPVGRAGTIASLGLSGNFSDGSMSSVARIGPNELRDFLRPGKDLGLIGPWASGG